MFFLDSVVLATVYMSTFTSCIFCSPHLSYMYIGLYTKIGFLELPEQVSLDIDVLESPSSDYGDDNDSDLSSSEDLEET